MRGIWLGILFLLCIPLVSASFISINTDIDIFNSKTQACIFNLGDEPAINISILLNVNGSNLIPSSKDILYPYEPYCHNFTHPKLNKGSFPVYSYTYFSDLNHYPFSALTVLRYGNSTDELEANIKNLTITNSGKIQLLIKNNANSSIKAKVKILGPKGAVISGGRGFINILPKELITIQADIANQNLLPNTQHNLFTIVEYDKDKQHHTVIANSLLRIKKPFNLFKQKYTWLVLAGIGILFYLIFYILKKKDEKQLFADIIILAIIFIFLLSFFTPSLIFSKTTANGGDTSSHYAAADYFANHIFPKPTGWYPGAYAGMPLFHFYFPAVFYIISLLAPLISLQIAFKIGTILGIFLLPPCMYFSLRFMKFKFPVPAIGAILTLPFLFMQSNSMWGGNIPSTLAGEFSYSFALALLVLYLGLLYKSVNKGKYIIPTALLLALIGLSHVYCLLIAAASSLFFLFSKKTFTKNLLHISLINGLAFLLISFWIFPLITKIGFTTSYADRWYIESVLMIFSKIIIPTLILAIFGIILAFTNKIKKDEDKLLYFFFVLLISLLLYAFAEKLQIINIRFIPFIQLLIAVPAAYGMYYLSKKLLRKDILLIALSFLVLFWITINITFIPGWVNWNYSGFEEKFAWPTYNNINSHLKGNMTDPRVVYEHSGFHNAFGTTRAFEMLPFFSGRSTLEGVYMQSSPSAPFIFYIQSLISLQQSCPFPNYVCSDLDYTRALPRLKMFNVNQIITVTDKAKTNIESVKDIALEKNFNDYSVYKIKNITGKYIEPLNIKPVLIETPKPALMGYLWFINDSRLKTPVVFTDKITKEDKEYFEFTANNLNSLPNIPFKESCSVSEKISGEKIEIKTDCIGKPLLIKISNFPNWKVKGAKKIYYAAPSFMLIFPENENITLYYGKTFFDILGIILSILGLIILFLIYRKKINFNKILNKIKFIQKLRIPLFIFLAFLIILFIIYSSSINPSNALDSKYRMEIAVEAGKYTLCRHASPYKDECFIQVAVKTNDANLCAVEVTEKNKGLCYEKVRQIWGNNRNSCSQRT